MSTEENYLDNLLKSITEPQPKVNEESIAEAEETVAEELKPEEKIAELLQESENNIKELEIGAETEKVVTEIVDNPVTVEVFDEPEMKDILEVPEELELEEGLEVSEEPALEEGLEVPEEPALEEVLEVPEEPELEEEIEVPEEPELEEEPKESVAEAVELRLDSEDLETADNSEIFDELEITDIPGFDNALEAVEQTSSDVDIDNELNLGEIADIDISEIPDIELSEEGLEPELDLGEIDNLGMPEIPDIESEIQLAEELNIDGLEEPVRSEMELEMSDELNLEEMDLDAPAVDDDFGVLDSMDIKEDADETLGVDDGLDDVLSMLDDDADLAEINDMLKKSDNNEPIQDEMMDLLNQMADDEAALINAGVKNVEADDGGVPIPDIPAAMSEGFTDADEDDDSKNKSRKASKKKSSNDSGDGEEKRGVIGRFFSMLTEELPGPTEEDYAAEAEAKAAKKQEELNKKEQDKLAKEEAKQAKAEEKQAAKKVRTEEAEKKKKEKQAAKDAKRKAKQEAEAANRAKRIPPKKIVATVVFGASVFGGVVIATNILSAQGYLNTARRAYYDGDYKSVYLATYGMELSGSDELIKAKSEAILKMQRWYDSYQNNLKLGREREALDALIQGIESYDYINGEAEEYGVLNEVDSIKNNILNVLESEYGVSEEQARALSDYEDALTYTKALNDIITGK